MISDSKYKVKLKTLVNVTCVFCVTATCEYFRNPQIFFSVSFGEVGSV